MTQVLSSACVWVCARACACTRSLCDPTCADPVRAMGCASSTESADDGGVGHQLWNACKAGDINAIERLIAEGADPNTYKDKVSGRLGGK